MREDLYLSSPLPRGNLGVLPVGCGGEKERSTVVPPVGPNVNANDDAMQREFFPLTTTMVVHRPLIIRWCYFGSLTNSAWSRSETWLFLFPPQISGHDIGLCSPKS